MVYDLSGVDVFFLVKELKTLEGAKVDKITQIDRKLFTIRFFSKKTKQTIRLLVPELVNLTNQKYDSPLTPMGFCSFLRKYLQNTKLLSVEQKSFERIILFKFETLKYGEITLILEMFKPGNMILCKNEDSRMIILNALERQEFKTRKIGAREEYIFPPEQNNPSEMDEVALEKLMNSSDKIAGKMLATDLSLGGIYAEEIIVRSGLDKNLSKLSSAQIKTLCITIKAFFAENIFCMSSKNRIFPVKMKSLQADETFSSFNEGLDSIILDVAAESSKTAEHKKKKSKTASLLQIQEKRIRELEREIDENQRAGEFIYEHYQEFQKLIDSIQDLRSKNKSFNEIEELLAKNKHFKKLDKAKKTVLMSWVENK